MTHRIHINIGSNSGCRHALIERAVAAVSFGIPGRLTRSEIIETAPWGFESPNPFLNIGLMIELDIPVGTDLEAFAHTLLHRLQAIEKSIDSSPHRDAAGAYIDRAIDIDLIAVGDLVIATPELILPHPRMHMRDFVLRPLAALDPSWVHPLFGLAVSQLLSDLG